VESLDVLAAGMFSLLCGSVELISSLIPLESTKLNVVSLNLFPTKALWASISLCVVGGVIFRIEAGSIPRLALIKLCVAPVVGVPNNRNKGHRLAEIILSVVRLC
jgi:hypothetical protein